MFFGCPVFLYEVVEVIVRPGPHCQVGRRQYQRRNPRMCALQNGTTSYETIKQHGKNFKIRHYKTMSAMSQQKVNVFFGFSIGQLQLFLKKSTHINIIIKHILGSNIGVNLPLSSIQLTFLCHLQPKVLDDLCFSHPSRAPQAPQSAERGDNGADNGARKSQTSGAQSSWVSKAK